MNSEYNNKSHAELRHALLRILIFAIISFLVLLIFSYTTSILYPGNYEELNGSYSVTNMLISKGITDGYMPYSDLFGIDGPIVYFLEAIGFQFGIGKIWIFVLQLINLTLTFSAADSLMRGRSFKERLFNAILICYVLCATLSGGNTASELCVGMLLLAAAITERQLSSMSQDASASSSHLKVTFIILGILSSAIIYIHMIHALIILSLFIVLLITDHPKSRNAFLYFLIAPILVSALIFGIMATSGSLAEFCFSMELQIKALAISFGSTNTFLHKAVKVAPLVWLAILFIISNMQNRENALASQASDSESGSPMAQPTSSESVFLFAILLSLIVDLMLDDVSWNLYIIMAVAVPFFFRINIGKSKCAQRIATLIAVIPFVAVLAIPAKSSAEELISALNREYLSTNEIFSAFHQDFIQDGETLLAVDVDPAYYLVNDCYPSYKYFAHQTNWSTIDWSISDDILEYLEDSTDTWLFYAPRGAAYEGYGSYEMVDYVSNGHDGIMYVYYNGSDAN